MRTTAMELPDNPAAMKRLARRRLRAREGRTQPQIRTEPVRCEACGRVYDALVGECACSREG